jgi:uncharacterized protein (TIGR02271 family)
MQRQEEAQRWYGMTVLDSEGEKIGTIDQVYMDDATGKPEWASITSGFLGMSRRLVPLAGATPEGDSVQAGVTKDQVNNSPSVNEDQELSESEESRLFEYYGIPYGGATKTSEGAPQGTRTGTGTSQAGTTTGTGQSMQRHEEELQVGRVRRPSELVRLKKRVETEPVSQTVPVQKEEVRIQREPVGAGATPGQHAFQEEEHEITTEAEEPVVEKRTVPKERVYVGKEQQTEERQIGDELRKERIDVERADNE